MRSLAYAVLACVALLPTASRAQNTEEEVKKLKEQIDRLQKTVETYQKDAQTRMRTLDQRPPIAYRAESVPVPAQLGGGIGRTGLYRPTISPYLNLARNQDDLGIIDLSLDYYLGTRFQIGTQKNDAALSNRIGGVQQQTVGGLSTTGHRTYFDTTYGRPAQQLYRPR